MLPIARKDYSRCRGMSLVEMILVMAILSVVMMAVISLYIPTYQSSVVQTQVSDVQGNLRLAMDRISADLVVAGFLVDPNYDPDSGGPLRSGPVYWEGDVNPEDPDDFTIRTRLVSGGFARVVSSTGAGDVVVTLSQPEMAGEWNATTKEWTPTQFRKDVTWVRLFNPVTARECAEYDETDVGAAAAHVYQVTNVAFDKKGTANDPSDDVATLTINTDAVGKAALTGGLGGNVGVETVVVRVTGESQPPLQTIRYRFNNGALERIVNEKLMDGSNNPNKTVQYLARNISGVAFAYEQNAHNLVRLVDVTLTGQTQKAGEGVVASAKTRQLQSTVTLRNVF